MRTRVAILLVVMVGLLVPAPTASARGVKVPFEGVENSLSMGEPRHVWTSNGVQHVRGQPALNDFQGTCAGEPCSFEVPFVLNVNVNLATGNGNAYGTFEYVTDGVEYKWGDRIGKFKGIYWAKIEGGIPSLTGVARGTGDFRGMILYVEALVPAEGPHPTKGWILNLRG